MNQEQYNAERNARKEARITQALGRRACEEACRIRWSAQREKISAAFLAVEKQSLDVTLIVLPDNRSVF